MRNPSQSIAGYRLTDHTRITELGAWFDAISPDGRLAGALRFDQGVIGLPGVRDRLVAAVVTDRRLAQGGVPGLVPVADVVAAGEQVWLLSGQGSVPRCPSCWSHGPWTLRGRQPYWWRPRRRC